MSSGPRRKHYNWHRYYDPSTGRYLEADPLGPLGGTNPFQYSRNDPSNFVDPLGLFGTADFVSKYFGRGRGGVDLGSTDLGGVFEASESVRGRIGEFDAFLDSEARKVAQDACDACGPQGGVQNDAFALSSTTSTSVRSEPGLFSVGGSAFFRSGSCHVSSDCKTGEYSYSCSTGFGIQDEFTDPLDGKEIFGVPFEVPGGTPYAITWSLQRKISGRGNTR